MKEEWKPISGCEKYLVSNTGKIYSLKTKKEIKPFVGNRGYLRVTLWNGDKQQKYDIHRLVALHFVDNPNMMETVNHINMNKRDNRVDNLEWVSCKENLYKNNPNYIGERKSVVCIETGEKYYSVNEAGRKLSIQTSTISAICKGEYDHYKGLHFKYLEEA